MSNSKEKSTMTAVAKINNTEILVIDNGEKRVAIKPICDALGINFSSQLQKIKNDKILGSTVVLSTTVGADEKVREMATIPFKFVFGWLFRIDSRNVKPEAKEAVLKYQLECYSALYDHFTRQSKFLQQRQKAVEALLVSYDTARGNFRDAEKIMRRAKNDLDAVRAITFEQWLQDQSQLFLFTENEMKGGQA